MKPATCPITAARNQRQRWFEKNPSSEDEPPGYRVSHEVEAQEILRAICRSRLFWLSSNWSDARLESTIEHEKALDFIENEEVSLYGTKIQVIR